VRRELDQLLTRTAGNRVLVQISIKAVRRRGNVFRNVKSRFVCLTVVYVEKEFALLNLNDRLWNFYSKCKAMRRIMF
jgi:hypothetical protein